MSTAHAIPFNYQYFIKHAARVGGRILDYGCGTGRTVELGRSHALDIWGVDTFEGAFTEWLRSVPPEAKERVFQIKDGHADFPDQHFDLVISNQVLEHVTDPEAVVADMHRVLKPGGTLISAFPVTETWYEGHVGLYFAHRFRAGSPLRSAYFNLCYRLGFGLKREGRTRPEWVRLSEADLDENCYYYRYARMRQIFERTFGGRIDDLGADYMRVRMGSRARYIPAIASPLLEFIYHVRAGEIWRVRKRP